jgi:hypothetical protein
MMRERCYNRVERAERIENGANGEDFLTQRRKGAENAKSWPMVRLGDVCEVIHGLWKGTKVPLVNVGVIRATNFTKNCEFDVSKTVYIDVEEKKFLKRRLHFGDIIVERSGGGPNQPVGRVIYFNQREGDYSLSNFTSALRVKNTIEIDSYYLYRILVACYVTGVTERMQSNSVQLRNLDFERYLNIQIPLRPLEIQKEIVERLEKELGEADKVARDIIDSDEDFRGTFGHSLGHSVGLFVHETPVLSPKAFGRKLRVGEILTVEPGIYIFGKYGCRIEDMVAIQKNGVYNFTHSTKDLIEIL